MTTKPAYLQFLGRATEDERSNLLEEIKVLKKVNKEPHPNIIRFIGICSLEGETVKKWYELVNS